MVYITITIKIPLFNISAYMISVHAYRWISSFQQWKQHSDRKEDFLTDKHFALSDIHWVFAGFCRSKWNGTICRKPRLTPQHLDLEGLGADGRILESVLESKQERIERFGFPMARVFYQRIRESIKKMASYFMLYRDQILIDHEQTVGVCRKRRRGAPASRLSRWCVWCHDINMCLLVGNRLFK